MGKAEIYAHHQLGLSAPHPNHPDVPTAASSEPGKLLLSLDLGRGWSKKKKQCPHYFFVNE